MFVTKNDDLIGPKWIINFPTKQHWRQPSQLGWIDDGLQDLKRVIAQRGIRSVALPPLGSGNGGLQWSTVRPRIEAALSDLPETNLIIYEPTTKYRNVAKRAGIDQLTPAHALIAELVRRYAVLGFDCTLLEIQKLAYLLERNLAHHGLANALDLQFEANRYGPFAPRLTHLLDALDGSYLPSDKRIPDAGPLDIIRFNDSKHDRVSAYLQSEASPYLPSLEATARLIDGFETPLGMELLATVDWLLAHGEPPTLPAIKTALSRWAGGADAGARKLRLFSDKTIEIALARLRDMINIPPMSAARRAERISIIEKITQGDNLVPQPR